MPQFICKPGRELWHQVEPEVRICWLERAHGREMPESLSVCFCVGRNDHFNLEGAVHSNPIINRSGPTRGKRDRGGKIKGLLADPVSCFFLWLPLLLLACSNTSVCVDGVSSFVPGFLSLRVKVLQDLVISPSSSFQSIKAFQPLK